MEYLQLDTKIIVLDVIYLIVDNGAEGDRTPGLMNAIHALSQLSYSPLI